MGNNIIYNISFPYIGVELSINPVAFYLGNIKIYWYGIILAVGFLSAYLYMYNRANEFKIDKNELTSIVVVGSIFGIIGARLYYVIFYPGNFYRVNLVNVLYISEGGLAIYGGIIVGVIAGGAVAYFKKMPILPMLDLTSFGLLIGQSVGRWGNFVNQEAFGVETSLPWGMSSEGTMGKIVHPCFLYESLWCFIIFLSLHLYTKSKIKNIYRGKIFFIYILFYGLGRFFIEGLRTDSLIIYGLKVSQLVSLFFVVLSMIFILIYRKQQIKTQC